MATLIMVLLGDGKTAEGEEEAAGVVAVGLVWLAGGNWIGTTNPLLPLPPYPTLPYF